MSELSPTSDYTSPAETAEGPATGAESDKVIKIIGAGSRPLNMMELKNIHDKNIRELPKVQQRRVPHKLGRNERCPCGSGQKVKKCECKIAHYMRSL